MTRAGYSSIDELPLSAQARSLWGKTDRDAGEQWLPLYVHMSDSALVAKQIWDEWLPEGTRKIIADEFDGDAVLARKTTMFLAGIHDLGKATPVFQSKPITYAPNAADGSMAWIPEKAGLTVGHFDNPNNPTHPLAGEFLLERYLKSIGWSKDIARSYASIVGSHHGKPPIERKLGELEKSKDIAPKRLGSCDEKWIQVQRELIEYVTDIAGIDTQSLARMGTTRLSPQSEVLLTAITIMADWIASNSEDSLFPLVGVRADDDGYRTEILSNSGLRARAERGWNRVNLPAVWKPEALPDLDNDQEADAFFEQRFQLPYGAHPRPVQEKMIELCRMVKEPGIIVLEAPMGEGKTEAALAAAEILGQRTGRGGVCVALPTMATTDAMFGRVLSWLDSLPQQGDQTEKSLWLAHGKAQLNDDFRNLVRTSRFRLSSIEDEPSDDSGLEERISAETVVSEWLWGNKKGVLANFLVCTIDQVLMSALRVKHVVLRQLALANKVVVIDECHAYDPYMQEYLKRALEWLGGFQTPVILLSATLPDSIRSEYIAAYQYGRYGQKPSSMRRVGKGRHRKTVQHTESTQIDESYPLITYTDGNAIKKVSIPPSGRFTDVLFETIDDATENVVTTLERLLADGGCAGVVCNTVNRAQALYECVRERFGDNEVILTHSRFIDSDRMANEEKLRSLLGPKATLDNGKRPTRMVVVGTQVLEQSLDIDFDVMISDVAPIDLIMQRVGRLHRHMRGENQSARPENLRTATCYIRGIEEWEESGPTFSTEFTRIYPVAYLMEALSVLKLRDAGACVIEHLPADIAKTVRIAYRRDAIEAYLPEEWSVKYEDACMGRSERIEESRKKANSRYLMTSLEYMRKNERTLVDFFGDEMSESGPRNEEKAQCAVRDTQETIEVMLLQRDSEEKVRLLPWVEVNGQTSDGIVVPLNNVPPEDVAKAMVQSSVHLPAAMSRYSGKEDEGIDELISQLENGCENETMMWQESPMLVGRLALLLQESVEGSGSFGAVLDGWDVSYSRVLGLRCLPNE